MTSLRPRTILFVACTQAALCACATAADGIRPQDEVFLINTRGLYSGYCGQIDWQRLPVYHFGSTVGAPCRRWIPISIDDFYAANNPSKLTLVYVHGNWVERGEDVARGLNFYRALLTQVPNAPPLRLVMFSWPTGRQQGLLRDLRTKAARADWAGLHLARILARMRPDTPLAIAGYSFGARVTTGALHVLAGGSLCGCALPERAQFAPVHVLLVAAAVHHDWLLPGGRHGRALQMVDRVVLINNPCDPAMRLYHAIGEQRRPRAVGRYGITNLWALGGAGERVVQFNACHEVGNRHGEVYYLSARSVLHQAGQQFLHLPSPPSPPPPPS